MRNSTDTYLLPLHFHSLCPFKKKKNKKQIKYLNKKLLRLLLQSSEHIFLGLFVCPNWNFNYRMSLLYTELLHII